MPLMYCLTRSFSLLWHDRFLSHRAVKCCLVTFMDCMYKTHTSVEMTESWMFFLKKGITDVTFWWNIFILFHVIGLHLCFINSPFYTSDNNSTLFTQTLLNTSRQHISNGQTQFRRAQSWVFSQWRVIEELLMLKWSFDVIKYILKRCDISKQATANDQCLLLCYG